MLTPLIRSSFSLLLGVLLQTSSCTISADDLVDDGSGDSSGGDSGVADAAPSGQIRVQLVNDSDYAVAVQLYATDQTGDAATVLFVEDNLITANVGFAGTGLLPAGEDDEILLNCDSAVMVGTLGGEFVDADTGEVQGTGQQRVLEQDLQFVCTETITLTYRENDDDFSTTLRLD